MGIAGTFKHCSQYESVISPMCPSCTVEEETFAHILYCQEEGHVQAFHASLDSLENWLEEMTMDPILVERIMAFARGRGEVSLAEYYLGFPRELRHWDFIKTKLVGEGMIVADFWMLQTRFLKQNDLQNNGNKWA